MSIAADIIAVASAGAVASTVFSSPLGAAGGAAFGISYLIISSIAKQILNSSGIASIPGLGNFLNLLSYTILNVAGTRIVMNNLGYAMTAYAVATFALSMVTILLISGGTFIIAGLGMTRMISYLEPTPQVGYHLAHITVDR